MMKPQKTQFEIKTPSAVLSVIGTDFNTRITRDKETVLKVVEGSVSFTNDKGKTLVGKGQQVKATSSAKPVPTKIHDMGSVGQWIAPLAPRGRRGGGMAKFMGILGVVAVIVLGIYYFSVKQGPTPVSSPTDQLKEAVAIAKMDPLPLDAPYTKPGTSWRTFVKNESVQEQTRREFSNMTIRSNVVKYDPEQGYYIVNQLENMEYTDKTTPETKKAAQTMKGCRIGYYISPEGDTDSISISLNKKLNMAEFNIFSQVGYGSDFTPLYIKNPITPGDKWTHQFDFEIPGFPGSYIRGGGTYQFTGYETHNGKEIAVVKATVDGSIGGGFIFDEVTDERAVHRVYLDDMGFTQDLVYIIDTRTGRVSGGYSNMNTAGLKGRVIHYFKGRNQPVTEQLKDQNNVTERSAFTVEYNE
jgi:hypothetical protein